MSRIVVLGAGVFGVTSALALRRRGHAVVLVDPGPLPRPEAASTDVSKIVRLDYGADALSTELMERALGGWRAWNEESGRTLFHEDGLLVLAQGPLQPGSFEGDSLDTLSRRGHRLQLVQVRRVHRDDVLAARSAQAQAPRPHGLDVFRPLVDQRHVVSGPREHPAHHAADRPRAEDPDSRRHLASRAPDWPAAYHRLDS